MDFDEAFNAHMLWSARFRASVTERRSIDARGVGRDDLCALGRWLHGEAKAKYAGLRPYARCVADHCEFHRQAGVVADLINRGRFDEAATTIARASPFMRAASEVGQAITDLERAIRSP